MKPVAPVETWTLGSEHVMMVVILMMVVMLVMVMMVVMVTVMTIVRIMARTLNTVHNEQCPCEKPSSNGNRI